MLKRLSNKIYYVAAILALVTFGHFFKEPLRGATVAAIAPLWEAAHTLKNFGADSTLPEQKSGGVLARVIYRPPSLWNSVLWVNAGASTNRKMGQELIQVNSPVVLGKSVVGAIDYVGEKQSRVRLITDSAMAPSVRVARGDLQLVKKSITIENALNMLLQDNKLASDLREEAILILEDVLKAYAPQGTTWFLAKGEVRGSGLPFWKRGGERLKGFGFNLEIGDNLSVARDLRTGAPVDSSSHMPAMPLIQLHDLLVTTGLDGVFPEGLEVGIVTKIALLREGDFGYELEAVPAAGSLNELSQLTILPAIGFDPRDIPFSFLRKNGSL